MGRFRWRQSVARSIVLLLVVPVLCMSVVYALFTQDLSLSGTTTAVPYTSNQSMVATYTKTQSATSPYTYTFSPFTVKNGGTTATSIWQVVFTVPSDTASLTCPTSVTCSLSGTTLTILSNTNGTIATGSSTAFTFSFRTATNAYVPTDIVLYANYTAALATIPGLTVNASVGSSTKSGRNYSWPLTVTVTNNSGKPLGGWQVVLSPFVSSYTVTGLPTGVTATRSTTLTLTSTNELATGSSVQLSLTVGTAKKRSWNVTSSSVQGSS